MGELISRFLSQIDRVYRHLNFLVDSMFGYVSFCLILVFSFIVEEKVTFTFVLLAIFFDFVLGVFNSIKAKKFTKSFLIQNTFVKITVYGIPLVLIGMTEGHMVGASIVFYATCALAIGCELWSILAHLLIISPNMPFLKILRFQLQDEIKSKTGKDINDLDSNV